MCPLSICFNCRAKGGGMVILGPRWLFSSTSLCSLNPRSACVYTNSVCLYCAGGRDGGGTWDYAKYTVYTHRTLRYYRFYDKYATSVKGLCQVYSHYMHTFLYHDSDMGRGSNYPHMTHA